MFWPKGPLYNSSKSKSNCFVLGLIRESLIAWIKLLPMISLPMLLIIISSSSIKWSSLIRTLSDHFLSNDDFNSIGNWSFDGSMISLFLSQWYFFTVQYNLICIRFHFYYIRTVSDFILIMFVLYQNEFLLDFIFY